MPPCQAQSDVILGCSFGQPSKLPRLLPVAFCLILLYFDNEESLLPNMEDDTPVMLYLEVT